MLFRSSLSATLGVAELVQLTDWVEASNDTSGYARASAANEGILEQFLREREESRQGELVGAR